MYSKENQIKQILMNRDGMTEKEAEELMDEVYDMMMDALESGDYYEAEEIFASELGLEPDYYEDLLL